MALTVPAWKLPFLLSKVIFDVLAASLLGITIRPPGWTYKRNISYTLLRSLSKYDLFNLIAKPGDSTTLDIYRAYMTSQKLDPDAILLENGGGGGWIGSPKSKQVLLYFHGSGYVNIASEFLFQMLGDLVTLSHTNRKDFSVFAIEYGLAPKATYPLQLIQAVTALRYLIETAGYSPENIYIGGDSAGAHVAIALLSSLSHPHPTAPPLDLEGKKLGGAFFMCPWVTFGQTSASMKENVNRDWLSLESLRRGSELFMDGAKEDVFNEPLSAGSEWWRDLKVQEIGVVAGGYEFFRDDIGNWVEKVKVHNPGIEYYLASGEIHDQAVLDRGLGLGMTKSEEFFMEWMMKTLKSVGSAQ